MTVKVESLPKYSKKEEIYNSWSHFIGALFGFASLITFIIIGINKGYGFIHMIPFYSYTIFMIMMFLVSGIYHSRPFNSKQRAISRLIDHADIYVFVLATYYPICIYGISNHIMSWTILIIEILLCILGIILNIIPKDNKAIKIISFIIYIVQGWLIIAFYPFNSGLPFISFIYILVGGIAYSIGAIYYAIGKYKKYSHTIFHIFVLIAAVLQFVGIILLV